MKNKNIIVIIVVAIVVLVAAVFGGYQIAESRRYVAVATDIADQFPLKAEPVAVNPQFAISDGPYAILHTTAGDITILLYPEQAPKAVENFITLAEEGYYDKSPFYYVKRGELAQGGKPLAGNPAAKTEDLPDGTKPKYAIERSKWEDAFIDEFSDELHNFSGAVGMAGDGNDNNLSQFYLLLTETKAEEEIVIPATMYFNELTRLRMSEFKEKYRDTTASEAEVADFETVLNEEIQQISTEGVPPEFLKRYEPAIARYQEVGGNWGLDYKQTVFGQIVDGLNVAMAMTKVKVEPSNRSPVKEIIIESVEIVDEMKR